MPHLDDDELIALATGDIDPAGSAAEHLSTCARCRDEMASYSAAAALTATALAWDGEAAEPGPERVWAGISDTLGLSGSARPAQHRVRSRWPKALAAASAAVILSVGVALGVTQPWDSGDSGRTTVSTADLKPVSGSGSRGTAEVVEQGDRNDLSVQADRLPLRQGYYEVWLLDPASGKMVSMGNLGDDGTGDFPMPPGLDLRRYHVVDLSAEQYDGNPAHSADSVLRGDLTS